MRNKVELEGNIAVITIKRSNGDIRFIIDDKDLGKVSKYTWWYIEDRKQIYSLKHVNGKRVYVWLWRYLLDAPKGLDVDHINRNRLDNRRINLRLCTRSQNLRNQPRKHNNSSGFKGVHKHRDKWTACIWSLGKYYYIGQYDNPVDAARAYNEKAKEILGEYAILNEVT